MLTFKTDLPIEDSVGAVLPPGKGFPAATVVRNGSRKELGPMPQGNNPQASFTKRVDLHCHSRASTEADEAVLQAIRCPESYSEPREIHDLAKKRGMDFVTITEHDSIAGVGEILNLPGVFVGEELTCYFPEDHCKIHLP